jgi:hypothetical protein
MIHKSFVPGITVNPVLEKYPTNQNLEDFIEVSEFKKFQIENKKIEKEDEDKIIINSKEDIELLEKLHSFLPEDKKFQIQNYFLDVNNNIKIDKEDNNNIKIFNHDIKNINEKTLAILNKKKIFNNNFETDNFSNSDFIKNVKSIIINFFYRKFCLKNNQNNENNIKIIIIIQFQKKFQTIIFLIKLLTQKFLFSSNKKFQILLIQKTTLFQKTTQIFFQIMIFQMQFMNMKIKFYLI